MCVHVRPEVDNHCLSSITVHFIYWTDSHAEPEGLELAPRIFLCLRDSDSPELTSSLSIGSVAYLSLNLQDCLAVSLFTEPFLQFLIFNCYYFFFYFKLSSIMPIPVYTPSSAEGFPSSNSWPALVISYAFQLNALQQVWSDVLLICDSLLVSETECVDQGSPPVAL